MGAPSKFYTFRETRYWAGSRPIVGFAERDTVEQLISTVEMSALFGGYLDYEDEARVKFRGVWGDRKVAKFRGVLEERGAILEAQNAKPETFRQLHRASH